jgi:flagellin-like hook-associated protein FlgL
MISLGSNIQALRTIRALDRSVNERLAISARLATGKDIIRASDDAAGLAIVESLNADVRVYSQGIRNLSDGLSMLSIASGALSELGTIQTRIIELTEQAANGTFRDQQRNVLQREVDALTQEMNRIVNTTTFNGVKIFPSYENQTQLHLQGGYSQEAISEISLNSLAVTASDGTIEGGASVAFTTSTAPWDVLPVDLNNDSFLDLTYFAGNQLHYAFGNGDGTFQSPVTITPTYTPATGRATFTDVNNDGNADLIVTGFHAAQGTGTLVVRMGNGDGTFTNGASYSSQGGWSQGAPQYEDLNADGLSDIVYSDYYTGELLVHLATGQGTFSDAVKFEGRGATSSSLTMGDLNGDGVLDAIMGSSTVGTSFAVLWGQGDGSFSSPSITDIASYGAGTARWVASGDFNEDGRDDLFVSRWSSANALVLLSNGDGTFAHSQTLVGTQISQVIDYNQDGHLDILSGSGGTFKVYIGNGSGTFANSATVATTTGQDPHGVGAADFNNDGALDIAGAIYASNTMNVILGNLSSTSYFTQTDISSIGDARRSLDIAKNTLDRVSSAQGVIGSQSRRIETTIGHLQSQTTTYREAQSRIEDADVAQEAAQYLRAEILSQVGVSILALNRRSYDLILDLLR